jgi:hypothetical protein
MDGYFENDFSRICQKSFVNINFNENLTIITVTVHENLCSFMIMSRSTLLTINDSVKDSSEKQNTQFIFNNFFQNVPL